MNWSEEAETAMGKVPFFVRKRVRKRVEEEAEKQGAGMVRIEHVKVCQRRFLNRMEDETRGFGVESCFGSGGCPNRAVDDGNIVGKITELLETRRLKEFLKSKIMGPLKFHHEFKVVISDCPNACSRPQIADIGLIGARRPAIMSKECNQCGSCVEVCEENAVTPANAQDKAHPFINYERCLSCGKCAQVCPTGALTQSQRGYRITVGGKLGRHPRLGIELPRVYSARQALTLIDRCVEHYKKHNREGERFGVVIERSGLGFLEDLF